MEGNRKVITARISGRRLALVAYSGWDRLDSVTHSNRNAEADDSTVIYAHRKRTAKNPAMELMILAYLHRTDDSEWTTDELSPIRDFRIMDVTPAFSPLGAEITLQDGTTRKIFFEEMDGNRRC
jgi:hypothetical protein